jgi:hypothetical protein
MARLNQETPGQDAIDVIIDLTNQLDNHEIKQEQDN